MYGTMSQSMSSVKETTVCVHYSVYAFGMSRIHVHVPCAALKNVCMCMYMYAHVHTLYFQHASFQHV